MFFLLISRVLVTEILVIECVHLQNYYLNNSSFFFSADIVLPQGEPGSTTMAQCQPHHISSSQFSPVHFDRLDPSRNQVQHIFNVSF